MTRDEAAKLLNGRESGEEMTRAEEATFRAAGLIVCVGQSDDIAGFFGAISDEIGAYGGAEVAIYMAGDHPELIVPEDDAEGLFRRGWTPPKAGASVKFEWCPDGFDGAWRVSTDKPHSTFAIMEDGKLFCRGVVIAVSDL
mgnify:CR=1 FL=1